MTSSTDTEAPTLLLVHGAWHGAWAWASLIPHLRSSGFPAIETLTLACVSGKSGPTQFDDAAVVRSALERLIDAGKRVVVVAHSYGAQVACAGLVGLSSAEVAAKQDVGGGDGVVGFINLCGYIYPAGMDQGAVIDAMGGLDWVQWDTPLPGVFLAKDPRTRFYAPDCTDEQAAWAMGQLMPQSTAANRGIVPPQAWQDDRFGGRFGYIYTTADGTVPYGYQRQMVEDSGGKERWVQRTLEGSGHSPMLSRPGDLAGLIREIVDEWALKR
jgi:pimeloyl-ACP methyl ester carboxylesterase